MILTKEHKQHIEEQIGHPDYFQCPINPGKTAIQVQVVSQVASGDIYNEYSPGKFALNVFIVSNTPC